MPTPPLRGGALLLLLSALRPISSWTPRLGASLCGSRGFALSPRTHGNIGMDITVCTGGACCEGGAELLLDACSVLAAGDATIEVKTAFCSGECPANLAMLSPRRGAMEAYEVKCSTVDEAIASATAAIAQAESQVGDGLTEVFVALAEAKAAALAGDAATARERYAAALAISPPGLLEPCQQPLEPETLEWAGSRWAEDWYSTELSLATAEESAEDPEAAFGTCGGGNRVVDRKVVPKPTLTLRDCRIDGLRLTGRWDDTDGGAGEAELLMSESGRTFEGSLRSDGAAPEAAASMWMGVRKSSAGGRGGRGRGGRGGGRGGRGVMRTETPPSRVKWVHEAWVAKARCSLTLGDADTAVADARAATVMCCRAPSGWLALAEALEANGEAPGAKEARAELAYLAGS